MSEEAKYEQWLDAAIAGEANSMSADEEHAFALDLSKIAAQAQDEEEWEEWLQSTASVFELPEEIPDICDKWWPKLPVSRAHGRVLRLHGLQGYERVRQKLWKGARTMRSRFKRSSAQSRPIQ